MASCPLIRPSVKDMRVDSSVGKRNEVLRSLAIVTNPKVSVSLVRHAIKLAAACLATSVAT